MDPKQIGSFCQDTIGLGLGTLGGTLSKGPLYFTGAL